MLLNRVVFPEEEVASGSCPQDLSFNSCFFKKMMSGCKDGYVWGHADFIDRSPKIKQATSQRYSQFEKTKTVTQAASPPTLTAI